MHDITVLQARYRLLERKQQRLSAACSISLLLSALLLFSRGATSAPSGTTLRAPLQIVDAEGHRLIEISSDRDGAALTQYDHQEKVVARIDAVNGMGRVSVLNGEGGGGAVLLAHMDGGQLYLTHRGDQRLDLQGRASGATLTFWDANEVPRVQVGCDGTGAEMRLLGRDEQRVELRSATAGDTGILIRAKGDRLRFRAP